MVMTIDGFVRPDEAPVMTADVVVKRSEALVISSKGPVTTIDVKVMEVGGFAIKSDASVRSSDRLVMSSDWLVMKSWEPVIVAVDVVHGIEAIASGIKWCREGACGAVTRTELPATYLDAHEGR